MAGRFGRCRMGKKPKHEEIMARREWTTVELAYLKDRYAIDGVQKVAEALGRDKRAVSRYAHWRGISTAARKPSVDVIEGVMARCSIDETDEDSCWIWGESVVNGIPIAHSGKSRISVRKRVWEIVRGKVTQRVVIVNKCDERCCVNPDHLKVQTRSTFVKEQMRRDGEIIRAARGQRAARARGQSVMTMEIAREIRATPSPAKDVASKYGVSLSVVSLIRRGETWRDYSALGEHRLAV